MSKDPSSSRSHDNWFAPDPRSTGSSEKHSIQDPRSIRSSDNHSAQDPRSIRSSDKHSVQDQRSIRSSDEHSVQDPRSIRSSDKRYVQDQRSLGSFDKHVDIGSKIYKLYGSWIFRILDPGSFSDHGTSLTSGQVRARSLGDPSRSHYASFDTPCGDKRNDTNSKSLSHLDLKLLATNCWWPRVTSMTSRWVTDEKFHFEYQ